MHVVVSHKNHAVCAINSKHSHVICTVSLYTCDNFQRRWGWRERVKFLGVASAKEIERDERAAEKSRKKMYQVFCITNTQTAQRTIARPLTAQCRHRSRRC